MIALFDKFWVAMDDDAPVAGRCECQIGPVREHGLEACRGLVNDHAYFGRILTWESIRKQTIAYSFHDCKALTFFPDLRWLQYTGKTCGIMLRGLVLSESIQRIYSQIRMGTYLMFR